MTLPSFAQSPRPDQATARPGNLPVINPVMSAASDVRSSILHDNYVAGLRSVAEQNLGEGKQLARYELFQLDPQRLFIIRPYPIRVYYLQGISGMANAMGFSFTLAGAKQPGEQFLVFPSTANQSFIADSGCPKATLLTRHPRVDRNWTSL